MKKFFKIFLILLYTVFLSGIAVNASNHTYFGKNFSTIIAAKDNKTILYNIDKFSDTAIVSSNANCCEISALKDDSHESLNIFRTELANSNNQTTKAKYYIIKMLNSRSHNISPNLKNEICTRAP